MRSLATSLNLELRTKNELGQNLPTLGFRLLTLDFVALAWGKLGQYKEGCRVLEEWQTVEHRTSNIELRTKNRDWDKITHRRASIEKAREVLGYEPRMQLKRAKTT
jgi:nucleoside-diphosphate-sugar epimerase